jgi:hypothetical protein
MSISRRSRLRFMRTAEGDGLSFEGNVFGARREYQTEVERNSTRSGSFSFSGAAGASVAVRSEPGVPPRG